MSRRCGHTAWLWALAAGVLVAGVGGRAQDAHEVVSQSDSGPDRGKRVVLLAGDHEYRSEETLPALARVLARHYGFTTQVFFHDRSGQRIHRRRPVRQHLAHLIEAHVVGLHRWPPRAAHACPLRAARRGTRSGPAPD